MPKEPTTPTADLINALAEFENVKANKINPAFKAKYISLDVLLESCKPILHKHNLALIQTLVSEEGKVGIETSFRHVSGTSFPFGKLMVKAENLTAQQIGGGISVDSDSDGNGLTPSAVPQANVATTGPLKQSYIAGTNNVR